MCTKRSIRVKLSRINLMKHFFFFIYFSLNFIKKMDDELAFQNL